MATIVLSAAGAAVGGALGGSVLGLSAAVIGRAVGATIGQAIDQRLMGAGSEVVETGRVDRFRLTGASEGTSIAKVYGRMRVAGQVIWSSNFLERRQTQKTGGGKGGAGGASVRNYSYSVSLAVALCEGEISHVGRVWADGQEVSRKKVSLRVYAGSKDQLPDPKISAIEGAENVPAYRGIAYVVIEDLDLSAFGNRVPQFSFEVVRPEQASAIEPEGSLRHGVRGVALVPGTGEYSLATTPVHYVEGPGRKRTANVHSADGTTDYLASMNSLDYELPNCRSISLVVSWFGNDLRCGQASIQPKVEHKDADGAPMPWSVAGMDRISAAQVPMQNTRPVYGGTPSDESVVQAIQDIRSRGKEVVFYPFILMEQLEGNGLTNPWTGLPDQPALPWRGRITLSAAPGLPGSPDGTIAAAAEVAAFFGTAKPSDFAIGSGKVTYSGPDEWTLSRFILHYAALCVAAGGVDAFCISSEMRGLTQIRGAGNSFPAVEALSRLTEDVRAILGSETKIGYAADWSEYFGYTPSDGSGDHFFHLDPLWAHPDIDFIGIDNYMPLSDWRDGDSHVDMQAGWETIYDINYLTSNIAGGEGFDWYYPDAQSEADQVRAPITDGAYNEPWVFRYKDLKSWWSNQHFDRIGGVRQPTSSAWIPGSKPFWFTEMGCAALDKATNQPNKFLDPKSSESVLPRASSGARDDLIQMQYLRAMFSYWADPSNNPASTIYNGSMVDIERAHVWAWDARPYPWFPGLPDVWSDSSNYTFGHWLNGRVGSQLLSTVVREICSDAGLDNIDVSRLYGLVRGYGITRPSGARAALEPLMLAFGFDAHERDGVVVFRNRSARPDRILELENLAVNPEQETTFLAVRASSAEMAGRVRLTYLAADGGFDAQVAEASFPGAEGTAEAESELNIVLTAAEARGITERWLSEARLARETSKFALPLSSLKTGAGDVVAFANATGLAKYRVDRSEQIGMGLVEAVRVETETYLPPALIEETPVLSAAIPELPISAIFLDLPLVTGEVSEHAPYLAAGGDPWPGEIAVYDAVGDQDYALNTVIDEPATIGFTENDLARAAPCLLDRGPALRVQMPGGLLSSVTLDGLLSGANAIAIGDGTAANWEVFQFQRADLIGPDLYDLSLRLRGQLGTDGLMPDVWPAGSIVVLLDGALQQISFPSSARGLSRNYRIGPAELSYDDPSFVHLQDSFEGVGLRPYAPVHLRHYRDATLEDQFSWIRRTRIDGDIWSLAQTPLGETREEYAVRILQNGTVVRQATAASTTWTYSAIDRTNDSLNGPYEFEVAQVSDRFGAGLFRRITINV